MTLFARISRAWEYRKTWRTPIGRDCISFDVSLCRWLADRLNFLAEHHHSYPGLLTTEEWARALRRNAVALAAYEGVHEAETVEDEVRLTAAAQKSLRWIAKNLPSLWD